MTTTKTYDFLNRLTSITSVPSGAGVSSVSFAYNYNHANQRTRATLADGSYWLYDYDTLGQVRSGKKYWSDGTFEYDAMDHMVKGLQIIGEIDGKVEWSKIVDESYLK